MTSSAEEIFKTCSLDVLLPNTVLDLPDVEQSLDGDAWLNSSSDAGERTGVFFDERLIFFFLIRFSDEDLRTEETSSSSTPSNLLLSFLNHLQLTVEALYIPPTPEHASAPTLHPSAKLRELELKLPTFPPQTPSPVPSTTGGDKKYVQSDGTPLKSFVWGEESADATDSFRLLWSERSRHWVSVYKVSLPVVFVRTDFANPLLCLTLSITLRDKPVAPTPARRTLTDLLKISGTLPPLSEVNGQTHSAGIASATQNTRDGTFEEVNLLDGLEYLGPNGSPLYLPTTRLPSSVRQAYSLPPLAPQTPAPTASSQMTPKTLPVLRKSFRKTVSTASGFHVRMRTVFIPHIYIPDDGEDGYAQNDAANEESTVVLCVEIQTADDRETGFSIEKVNVVIGGEGAKLRLISWGDKGPSSTDGVFPIVMRPSEQYNLLYAVSFLRPAELDLPSGAVARDSAIFHRSVSIVISGRPFQMADDLEDPAMLSYPTAPFLSRWNCVLDLTPRRSRDSHLIADSLPTGNSALPFPMSPFPPASPHPSLLHDPLSVSISAATHKGQSLQPTQRFDSLRSVTPTQPTGRLTPSARLDVKQRPSSYIQSSNALSPPLPPIPLGDQNTPTTSTFIAPQKYLGSEGQNSTPQSILPSFGQAATIGSGATATRARCSGGPGHLQTPGPRLLAGERTADGQADADFVVSVRLLPPEKGSDSTDEHRHIRPLDEFSLEIFVFNRSKYPRTLEATYPDNKYSKEQQRAVVGFTPLESRIKIGPLAQSSCQSVRMRFLAILPGIHTIDGLILTDVETGHATSLRSVLDFAVVSADQSQA